MGSQQCMLLPEYLLLDGLDSLGGVGGICGIEGNPKS